MADQRADPFIGRTVADKYKIEACLGRGAMGAVYRARQTVLNRSVAIKVLNSNHLDDSTFASRFKREAKTASMFEHPNSLRVLDFGQEPDGLLYLVMEFIDGRDLLRVIREDWPLSKARIVEILSQALAALAVAHGEGILHRDLKPENIMVVKRKDDEGRSTELVKVCDFGIAKVLENKSSSDSTGTQTGTLTAHGMLVGTPEYMSPEYIKSEPLDARSDLYAIGVMLYQMLTGRLPFEAASGIKLIMKHVSEKPKRPSEINPRIDPRFEVICLKALEKNPGDRFSSAREFRTELRAVLEAGDSAGASGAVAATDSKNVKAKPNARRDVARGSQSAGGAAQPPPARGIATSRRVLPLAIAIVIATAVICTTLLYLR